MKQNKQAIFLIFATAIVTSGLAISTLVYYIENIKKAYCFLRSNKLFFYYKIPKNLFTQLIIISIDTATHITIALRSCFSFCKCSTFLLMCTIPFILKKCEIGNFSYPMRGEYENPLYLTYTIEWNCHFINKMT